MNERQKEWYLGIDFGTSNTYIVAYEKTEGKMFTNASSSFENGLTDGALNIPTVITADLNDEKICYYCGNEAIKKPFLRLFRGLKNAARQITPENGSFGGDKRPCEYPFEQCSKDTLIQLGNNEQPFSPTASNLLIEFFKKILHIEPQDNFGINKDTVKKIVIGRPVAINEGSGTTVDYEETLKDIIAKCFPKVKKKEIEEKISVVAESQLAGATFLFSGKENRTGNVLVVDIGGGTTDFSVLRYNNGNVEAENLGNEPCNIAGNDIDDFIFSMLPDGISKSKVKCREWKEYLFTDHSALGRSPDPISTDDLNGSATWIGVASDRWYLCYGTNSEVINRIILSTGEVYKGKTKLNNGSVMTIEGKRISKIQDIFELIAAKLQSALDVWKETHEDSKIDTVFFVGGTSMITPLRETLLNAAEKSGVLAKEFNMEKDVVNAFGSKLTVSVRGCGEIPIDHYNAVAVGALIEAMGSTIIVRPNVSCTGFYTKNKPALQLVSNGFADDLLVLTDKDELLAYTFYDNNRSQVYRNDGLINQKITFCVDGEEETYLLNDEQIQMINKQNGQGLVFALVANQKHPKGEWKVWCADIGSDVAVERIEEIVFGK